MFSFTSAFGWDPTATPDPSPFIQRVKGLSLILSVIHAPYSECSITRQITEAFHLV